MTRGKQDKLYRSFNKGLITEAGFLTYPEDASIDELNTVIYRKGNRSRRAGIDYEDNSTEVTFEAGTSDNSVTNEYYWKAPGDRGNLNFLVVQVDTKLYFFDSSVSPLSEGKKVFTVNLLDFKAPTASNAQVSATRVHMASGNGVLFVAQQYVNPIAVSYDHVTDTINPIQVFIQMRDFDGVSDGYANDYEPSALTPEHHYNLFNQGWVSPGSYSTTPSTGGTTTNTGSSNITYDPWSGRVINRNDPDTGAIP